MWPDRRAYKEHRMRLQKDLRRQQSIDKRHRRLLERPVQQLHDSKTPTAGKGQNLARMFRRVHDSWLRGITCFWRFLEHDWMLQFASGSFQNRSCNICGRPIRTHEGLREAVLHCQDRPVL